MFILILRWVIAIMIAFAFGKLVSKLKLPSILGWLIGGMVLGPYALALLPNELIGAAWYENIIHVLECAVGLMIGTELVWKRIRQYGKALMITTLIQSLGTFAVVSAVFGIVFTIQGIPLYLAFLFGGIALATAPAPALSIVREFKTDGPVTKTLIPMAALDDMVGVAVFFTAISIVARHLSSASMPVWMIPVMIFLPLVIGVATGIPAGFLLKKESTKAVTLTILIGTILTTAGIGFLCNQYLMSAPVLNFMLMGMAGFGFLIPEKCDGFHCYIPGQKNMRYPRFYPEYRMGDGNSYAHIMPTMRSMDEHEKWNPKAHKVYDFDERMERIVPPSGEYKSCPVSEIQSAQRHRRGRLPERA